MPAITGQNRTKTGNGCNLALRFVRALGVFAVIAALFASMILSPIPSPPGLTTQAESPDLS